MLRDSLVFFRKALRSDYREVLNSALEKGKTHEDIVVVGMHPMEQLILSIMLEHEKDLIEIRERLISR